VKPSPAKGALNVGMNKLPKIGVPKPVLAGKAMPTGTKVSDE